MKKGLLIASIASVTAVSAGLAFAVANANKGIRFEAAKATSKSIVFSGTQSLPSPAGVFETYNTYQVSSYTGSGDPVDVRTEGMLSPSGAQTSYKIGGDYYMSNYHVDGGSSARLITTIGLHNVTALSVEFGTTLNYHMNCSIYFYKANGEQIANKSQGSSGDVPEINTLVVDFEELALTDEVRKVQIYVYPSYNINLDNGSFFIKSISASWEC